MSAIAAILLDAAAGLAVPIVKKILGDKLGGAGGKVAGELIDTIADKIGVTPADIPEIARTDPDRVEAAIVAAEPVAAELVLAAADLQRAGNEQLLSKDRPKWVDGWQWFLMFLWGVNGPGVMLANAITGAALERMPWDNLMYLTIAYQTWNMGGHAISGWLKTWKAGQ